MDLLITYTHHSGTTSNYSAAANLHTSEIGTAPAEKEAASLTEKPPLCSVRNSRQRTVENPKRKTQSSEFVRFTSVFLNASVGESLMRNY
jgi:hypothetical protein